MTYQPIEKLDRTRLPDVIHSLERNDLFVETFDEQRVNRRSVSKAQEHMADVTMAMLFMPCGGKRRFGPTLLRRSRTNVTNVPSGVMMKPIRERLKKSV